jgi:hypothetical protein
LLFSLLAIIFGAIVFARPKGAGIGLVIVSILGAILGGTFVAICMGLSLVGGVLAVVSATKSRGSYGRSTLAATQPAESGDSPTTKRRVLIWSGIGVAAALALLILVGTVKSPELGSSSQSAPAATRDQDPLSEVVTAVPSDLHADGELAQIFTFGSEFTDLQRENKAKEIIGQVVLWTLPVYEVSRAGERYKVQTSSGLGATGRRVVTTFVYVTARDDADRRSIEALKTGDLITFKGRIAGIFFRSIEITPAVLVRERNAAQAIVAPAAPAAATQGTQAGNESVFQYAESGFVGKMRLINEPSVRAGVSSVTAEIVTLNEANGHTCELKAVEDPGRRLAGGSQTLTMRVADDSDQPTDEKFEIELTAGGARITRHGMSPYCGLNGDFGGQWVRSK